MGVPPPAGPVKRPPAQARRPPAKKSVMAHHAEGLVVATSLRGVQASPTGTPLQSWAAKAWQEDPFFLHDGGAHDPALEHEWQSWVNWEQMARPEL